MKPRIPSNLRCRLRAARAEQGNTLLIALSTATILVAVTGTSMMRTVGATRINARASSHASASRAVDGALEYAFGVWKTAVVQKDAPLVKTISSDNAILTGAGPDIPGYAYTTPLRIDPVDAYGSPAQSPTRVLTYLAGYPGWRGFACNYVASVRMEPTDMPESNKPEPTGAKRLFQWVEVPLFQSMYFYEHDLEIYRPAPMIVGGLVHSNSRMLLSGSKDQSGTELTFQGMLSYAGGTTSTAGYTASEPPIGGPAWAGFTVAEAPSKMEAATFPSGIDQQLSKVDRYEPLGKQPTGLLNPNDSNPNDDSYAEIIEPPVTTHTDKPEIAKRRMYNKAGIVVTITGTSVTVTAKNGATLDTTKTNAIKAAFTGKNTFYDQREGKNVDAANINVGALTPVLNTVSGFNGVLYIQDATPVNGADPEPKTVRLKNGGKLPDAGLTIASVNPVYVQGDYNTGTTTNPSAVQANATGNPNNTDRPTTTDYTRKPAAVMADAVMLLSNNWNDANASASVTGGSRNATNTTFNMAILAGTVPSGYDADGPGGSPAYGYSGGANNYPRFLENWSGKSCTYHGSMVELFQSKTFKGKWDTGVIYRPPNRRWNFDTMFVNNPPPGSLDAVAVMRGGWAKF